MDRSCFTHLTVIPPQTSLLRSSCHIRITATPKYIFVSSSTLVLTNLITWTTKVNFNCLYNPLTTIHLPYGLTLTSPASEKGRLLPSRDEMGYYKLHTLGPLHSSGSATQQLISSLTFIPQISIHKGAVFKCQVSYVGKDKIVVERVSEKFTILCKKYILLILCPFFIYFLTNSIIYVSGYFSFSYSRSIRNSTGRMPKWLRFELTMLLQFKTSNLISDYIS